MTAATMAAAEVSAVCALLGRAYALLARREGLTAAQRRRLVEERGSPECVRREAGAQQFLVARDRDEIVGLVAISGDSIEKLYVDPRHVGSGVGRFLFETAESRIAEAGHRRVRLGAFPTAVPFYERMGLSVVGEKAGRGLFADRVVYLMEKPI